MYVCEASCMCNGQQRYRVCSVYTHVCSNVQMSDTVLYQISDTPDTDRTGISISISEGEGKVFVRTAVNTCVWQIVIVIHKFDLFLPRYLVTTLHAHTIFK